METRGGRVVLFLYVVKVHGRSWANSVTVSWFGDVSTDVSERAVHFIRLNVDKSLTRAECVRLIGSSDLKSEHNY